MRKIIILIFSLFLLGTLSCSEDPVLQYTIFDEAANDPPVPVVSTLAIQGSFITAHSAVSGGEVTDDAGLDVTERGVVWDTNPDPTLTLNEGLTRDGWGMGRFTSNLTGLNAFTVYYVRAYAINAVGTSYGKQVSFTTDQTTTKVVEVTNPVTGRVWMDRNLGASRAATSSTDEEAYGDLYQWGRAADGHQYRNSGTTYTLSSSDQPGHGDFILVSNSPYDWRSPQNDNLWQGEDGINNPCPEGYRLPTAAEWEAERQSWSSINSSGAFASPLKLSSSGYRNYGTGSLNIFGGSLGYYWSGTVSGTFAWYLFFNRSDTTMVSHYRAYGGAVRCTKD